MQSKDNILYYSLLIITTLIGSVVFFVLESIWDSIYKSYSLGSAYNKFGFLLLGISLFASMKVFCEIASSAATHRRATTTNIKELPLRLNNEVCAPETSIDPVAAIPFENYSNGRHTRFSNLPIQAQKSILEDLPENPIQPRRYLPTIQEISEESCSTQLENYSFVDVGNLLTSLPEIPAAGSMNTSESVSTITNALTAPSADTVLKTQPKHSNLKTMHDMSQSVSNDYRRVPGRKNSSDCQNTCLLHSSNRRHNL